MGAELDPSVNAHGHHAVLESDHNFGFIKKNKKADMETFYVNHTESTPLLSCFILCE